MALTAGRPRMPHPTYELEEQIVQARQAIGRRRVPVAPAREEAAVPEEFVIRAGSEAAAPEGEAPAPRHPREPAG